MGVSILADDRRAVLYCNTVERALDHELFMGDDAREKAQSFLEWLPCDPRDVDELAALGYTAGPLGGSGAWYPALDHAIQAWGSEPA
jgi:hypothetical protein